MGLLSYVENNHNPQVKSLLRLSGSLWGRGDICRRGPWSYAACLPQLNGLFPRHCSLLTQSAAASTRAKNIGAGHLSLTLSSTLSLTGPMQLSLHVLLGSKQKKRSQFSSPLSFCNCAGWSEKETEGKPCKKELANVQRKKTSSYNDLTYIPHSK